MRAFMLGMAKMMHDFALLRSLVLGVIDVIGVASVIGVAARPATSRKANEYARYARYARMQKSSEQSNWAANSVPETRIRSFARSPPHCAHQARYRPDIAAGNHSRLASRFLSKLTETAKNLRETDVYRFQN
jgi:hypothetical protein